MSSVVDQGDFGLKDTTVIALSSVSSADTALLSYERPSHCLRVIVAVSNDFYYNNTMV